MNTCFVVEFYEERTCIAPLARGMVLEDVDDAAHIADRLKLFFDHLIRSSHPQFHDAGLMCVRFVHWQLTELKKNGIGPECRNVFFIRQLGPLVDYPVAEIYANSFRPEVRFKRTEVTAQWELLDAAEVLGQANI